MSRAGPRVRLAPGVYRDRHGIAAVVTVHGWRREHRFPLTARLRDVKAWRDDERARLTHSGVARSTRGSLAGDVDVYLQRVRHLAGWVSLRSELRHWIKLYGPKPRRSLRVEHVEQARERWRLAGVKPKTINNRVAALNRLWHKLDGARAVSPGDELAPLHVHRTPIRVIDNATVIAVYQRLCEWERSGRLRDAKTRARFMVYAATGRRPSEIARTQPGDVDLERRVWTPRDGKGGWSPGVYLNDDARAAWQVFVDAGAWGTFREGTFVRTLRRAGWPEGVRPYNLRHTVGMSMSEAGVDLADIQPHLGHKRIETTRKHYVAVLGSRLQRASEAIDHRFGWSRVVTDVAPPTESTT